jgi:hypothetical protein
MWIAATTAAWVGFECESWLEQDRLLLLLDFDPDAVGIASQQTRRARLTPVEVRPAAFGRRRRVVATNYRQLRYPQLAP